MGFHVTGAIGTPVPSVIDLADEPRSLRRRLRRHGSDIASLSSARLSARLRESLQVVEDRRQLEELRGGRDVCWPETAASDPLVTVRITTYNRGPVLVERAIASALAQTHDNIEVLVVGDCCTDNTEMLVSQIADPRLRFVNLPRRPPYPSNERDRWLTLGYAACNLGLDLATGDWIAPCDDDDELTPDHVERLLATALTQRAEFVHSRTAVHVGDEDWATIGRPALTIGQVTHGSVLYASALRFMRYSGRCWERREPLDWHLFRRIAAAGARVAYLDDVTYRYYPSGATAAEYRRRVDRARTRRRGAVGRLLALIED